MEPQSSQWLPLTEYAIRSGMSISTLRRKIKSNTIEYKMEEGRYLIRSDDLTEGKTLTGFQSSDDGVIPSVPHARPQLSEKAAVPAGAHVALAPDPARPTEKAAIQSAGAEIQALREDFLRLQEANVLRWKALEARVSGLAKQLEFFSEQMAEAKMLVKLFEEKLDHRA